MSEQYDSLNEKTRMIEMSLKFVNGDMEKAKAMAAGQYLDNIAVKTKFFLQHSGRSGLFFAFFNIYDEYISFVDAALVTNDSIYEKVRIFDDWKSLYSDMNAYKSGGDIVDMSNLPDLLIDGMVEKDIFPYVQESNLDELSRNILLILKQVLNDDSAQCQVEIEPTSSLAMDMGGIPLVTPQSAEPQEESPKPVAVEETEFERRIREIEEEANFVVEGTSIVAPVKGKYINDIQLGEKIMVLLPGKDPVSRKILSVLNAVDSEGRISPIKGRVKEKVPLEKSGYMVYALVAKGVLAKLTEEENVKIRMEAGEDTSAPEKEGKMVYFMAFLVILIIIAGIVLFNML